MCVRSLALVSLQRLLSSFLVSAVLSEFSSSSSSSYMGLSFDFHLKSKKVFEVSSHMQELLF